jgi:hypothetical protein
MPSQVKKVFLSSTYKDLTEHRKAIMEAIERLDDYKCVWMEWFGARDKGALASCRQKVAECQVFVGLIGHLYGSCPPDREESYTVCEYDVAQEFGKPCLMFLSKANSPIDADLIEPDESRKKQSAFRVRVSAVRTRDSFIMGYPFDCCSPCAVRLAASAVSHMLQ